MMVEEPTEPREPGELFKFIAEVKTIFPADSFEQSYDRLSLVSSAGKYGLIFIANHLCIKVFKSSQCIDQSETTPITTIIAKGLITHISVNCDGQTLFVVAVVNNIPFGFFYDVCNIAQNGKDPFPFYSMPLSTIVGSRIASLCWNPCDPNCLAVALSSGELVLIKIKESSIELCSKKDLGANSVAWSAKGKQLAVGKNDATISLFKPDLTLVRSIEAPSIEGVGSVIDITWFTNTEFFIGYLTPENFPALVYVNAPKGTAAKFVTFEDVCYSYKSEKPVSYYTIFVNEWNLLFVFSSNGVELGVIGKTEREDSACKWCVWSPEEGATASMHFYDVVQETFPLGLAIDYTSQRKFPSKDEKDSGPLPALVTVSTKGEMNVFFIENGLGGEANLTSPSANLPLTGHRTPQQFGQIVAPQSPPTPTAEPFPTLELKRNSASAFSSISKKTEIPPPSVPPPSVPFSFTTPVKPASEASAPKVGQAPAPTLPIMGTLTTASSSPFSFAPASTSPNVTALASPFCPKPVSLGSQIGATPLFAPNPKRSIAPSSVPLPQFPPPAPTAPTTAPFDQPRTTILAGASSSTSAASTAAPPPAPPASVPPSPAPPPPPVSKISRESLLYRIGKEKEQFEREMKELRSANDTLECLVGSEKEDAANRMVLEEIREWMADMKRTTQEQSDEVGYLHQKTLEALASYEDANSHKQTKFSSRNQIYQQLRPLDPYSQRKLDEARSKYQYLVTQIREANVKLDLQWEQYSDMKKPRRLTRDQRSAAENLYRSVLNLHNVRVAAEKQLDNVGQQLKKLSITPLHIPCSGSFYEKTSHFKILSQSHSAEQAPSPAQISPNRNRQLKEVLAQRVHTPVRVHSISTKNNEVCSPDEMDVQKLMHLTPQKSCDSAASEGHLYEAISPPTSPLKRSSQVRNPLAALSSLVGNVSKSEASSSSTATLSFPNLFSRDSVKAEATVTKDASSSFSFALNKAPKEETPPPEDNKGFTPFQLPALTVSPLPGLSLGSNSPFGGPPPFQVSLKPGSGTVPSSSSQPLPVSGSDLFSSSKVSFAGLPQSSTPTAIAAKVSLPSSAPLAAPETTSPLVGMLNTNKSIGEFASDSALNMSGFFKNSSNSMPSPVSGSLDSMFASNVGSSSESKAPSASFTADKLSTAPSMSMFKSFSTQIPTSSSSPVETDATLQVTNLSTNAKVATEPSSIITANPILSAQILKDPPATMSISPGFFGHLAASSSVFSPSSSVPVIKPSTANGELSVNTPTSVTSSLPQVTSLPAESPSSSSSMFSGPSAGSNTFGQPSISSTSVFVQPTSSTTSIFAPTTTSSTTFGQSASISASIFAQPTSSSASIFAQPTSSSASIFSQPASSSSSLFGLTVSSSSIIGQPASSSASIFGQTASSSASVFGQPASSSASVFGQPATSSASIFGQPASSSASIFGQPASSSASIIGQSTTSSGSMFGQPASSSASIFGQSTTSTATFGQPSSSSAPLFGQPSTSLATLSLSTTNTTTVLGQGSITTDSTLVQPGTSSAATLFTPPATSTASPFTQTATSTASLSSQPSLAGSLFSGQAPSSNSSFMFNQPGKPTFGSSNPAPITTPLFSPPSSTVSPLNLSSPPTSTSFFSQPSTASSSFGATTVTSSSTLFGQTVTSTAPGSTSTPVFGGQAPLEKGSSLFGGQSAFAPSSSSSAPSFAAGPTFQSSSFGSLSSFGKAAQSPSSTLQQPLPQSSTATSTASLFSGGGFGSTSGSVFGGQQSSIFGNAPATPQSTASVFGGAIPPAQEPSVFGGNSANAPSLFSPGAFNQNAANNSTFAGGSIFSGLGKTPSKEDASKNVFGVVKTSASQPSIFGGSGGNSSSPFSPNPPQMSAGNFAPVKTEGSSIFGGKPSFGGSPAFGDAGKTKSIFGGEPVFGGAPAFGGGPSPSRPSTTSVFGGNSSAFSSSSTSQGGFGSFAASAGSTFGGLAGTTNQNPGGSSFTSWRS